MSNSTDPVQAIQALLIDLENRRCNTVIDKHLYAMAAFFDDDLVYVHSTGVVQDKAAYLEYSRKGPTFKSIKRGDLVVRVYGDVAVMTGETTNAILPPNAPAPIIVEGFVTQVWRNNGEKGWQMVSFQTTRSPVAEGAK